MTMLWFGPMALALGAFGTRTALQQRHLAGARRSATDTLLGLVIFWLPLGCLSGFLGIIGAFLMCSCQSCFNFPMAVKVRTQPLTPSSLQCCCLC